MIEHQHHHLLHYIAMEKELREHLTTYHARKSTAEKASWRSCVAAHNEAHEEYAEVPDNERDRAKGWKR